MTVLDLNKSTIEVLETTLSRLQSSADLVYEARNEEIIAVDYNPEDYNAGDVLIDILDSLVETSGAIKRALAGRTRSNPIKIIKSDDEDDFAKEDAEEMLHERLLFMMNNSNEGKWTVTELSHASGVRRETILRILDGITTKPHAKTVAKLEKVLGIEKGALGV